MRVFASLSGGVTAAKKRTVEQLKLTEHVWCRYQGRNPESHGSHDVRFWHFADINSTTIDRIRPFRTLRLLQGARRAWRRR